MNNISIREYIIEGFKEDNESEIRQSIEETINEGLEEALPGLGVFMEIIWKNADDKQKDELLKILKDNLK